MNKKEIEHFIKQLQLSPQPSYFLPATNQEIIARMLNNLIFVYKRLAKHEKVSEIEQLRSIFEPAASQE